MENSTPATHFLPANWAGLRPLSNGLVALVDWDGNTMDVVTPEVAAALEAEAEDYGIYA